MSALAGVGLLTGKSALYALAAIVILEVLAIVLVFAHEGASRRAEQARLASTQSPDVWWRGNLGKAISCPPTFTAKEAKIGPQEVVVGVEVGGKARAYRIDALGAPSGHVVNDLVGGVCVSVTYCDLNDCVRVYTAHPQGSSPLDVETVGLLNSEMVVKIGGTLYFQESGKPVEPSRTSSITPYHLLDSTRTTWEAWARAHPETDVYMGDRRTLPRGYTRLRPSFNDAPPDGQEGHPGPHSTWQPGQASSSATYLDLGMIS